MSFCPSFLSECSWYWPVATLRPLRGEPTQAGSPSCVHCPCATSAPTRGVTIYAAQCPGRGAKDRPGLHHSYPLALSLIADLYDQRPGFHFKAFEAPDVIRSCWSNFSSRCRALHIGQRWNPARWCELPPILAGPTGGSARRQRLFDRCAVCRLSRRGRAACSRTTWRGVVGRGPALAQPRMVCRTASPGPPVLHAAAPGNPRAGAAARPVRLRLPASR